MFEGLDIDEVILQEENVLSFKCDDFNCEGLSCFLFDALLHYSVRSFSSLLSHAVFLIEK